VVQILPSWVRRQVFMARGLEKTGSSAAEWLNTARFALLQIESGLVLRPLPPRTWVMNFRSDSVPIAWPPALASVVSRLQQFVDGGRICQRA